MIIRMITEEGKVLRRSSHMGLLFFLCFPGGTTSTRCLSIMNRMRPSFLAMSVRRLLRCIIHGIRPRYSQVNYYPVVLVGSLCILGMK